MTPFLIISVPGTITPSSLPSQQRGLQCARKNALGQRPWLSASNQIKHPPSYVTSSFLVLPLLRRKMFHYPMVGRPSGCFSVWGNHGKLWSIPKWRTDLSLLGAQWSAVKSVWERLSSTWKQYWQLSYLTSNPKQEGHQEERTLWRRHSPKTQRNEVRNGNLSLLYPVPGLFHSLHSI